MNYVLYGLIFLSLTSILSINSISHTSSCAHDSSQEHAQAGAEIQVQRELCEQRIRTLLQGMHVANWHTIPLEITPGNTLDVHVLRGLRVGTDYCLIRPLRETRAALGHEIIHYQEKHNLIMIGAALLFVLILCIIAQKYSRVLAGYGLTGKRHLVIIVLFSVQFYTLLSRQLEKRADLISATRYNSAPELIKILEEAYVHEQTLKSSTNITSTLNRYLENVLQALFIHDHPSIQDRIDYLKPLAEKQYYST